jgi:uncharacterized membrane protein
MRAGDEDLGRLEVQLGRLLLAGVLISTACLAAGLVLTLAGAFPRAQHLLLTTGLIVLMATPILRVVVSMIEYVRMRDWFFVVTTLTVLAVLAGSVMYALTR